MWVASPPAAPGRERKSQGSVPAPVSLSPHNHEETLQKQQVDGDGKREIWVFWQHPSCPLSQLPQLQSKTGVFPSSCHKGWVMGREEDALRQPHTKETLADHGSRAPRASGVTAGPVSRIFSSPTDPAVSR